MFGHYSYLILMLIIVFIALAILWGRYSKELWANKVILIEVAFIAVVYQFVSDPFAEAWRAWFFSNDKILGIWIINFPIENTLFFALNAFTVACAVIGFITHQRRHNAKLK